MDMEANHGDDRLPHDVLLEILRRLPLRALVQSRRVCRAWHATIDDSTLLLTHFRRLFPRRAFPGVFTSNDETKEESSFFAPALSSRPSKVRRDANGDEHGFRYPLFNHGWAAVKDHCNGLLLLYDEKDDDGYYCVCNPATVRCARLPSPPMSEPLHGGFWEGVFLAFDPAVARHHEVFLFPQTLTQLRPGNEVVEHVQQPRMKIPMKPLNLWRLFNDVQPSISDDEDDDDNEEEEIEQPKQPQDQLHANEPAGEELKDEMLTILVFSSVTHKWESREFAPGSCNSEHLYDFFIDPSTQIWKSAEYWRGSLYVHCHKNILMILRNSHETYDMVQLPGIPLEEEERTGIDDLPTRSVLGSYEKGIRYVALDRFQLQVWVLNEPADGQLGWTLTHETNLNPYVHSMNKSLLPTQLMVPWKALKSKKGTLSLFEPLSDIEKSYLKEFEDRHYGPMGRKTRTKSKKDPKYSWDSDEDNFIGMDESIIHLEPPRYGHCRIIGSHPHKDALLLRISGKALVYHLSTSKMQFLGKELVRNVQQCSQLRICYGAKRSFPYRPCYVDALPTTKMPRGKHDQFF